MPVKVAGIPQRSVQRPPYQIAASHLVPNDRAEISLCSPLDRALRHIFPLRMRALYGYRHKMDLRFIVVARTRARETNRTRTRGGGGIRQRRACCQHPPPPSAYCTYQHNPAIPFVNTVNVELPRQRSPAGGGEACRTGWHRSTDGKKKNNPS